jgi:hypothetical protein
VNGEVEGMLMPLAPVGQHSVEEVEDWTVHVQILLPGRYLGERGALAPCFFVFAVLETRG